MIIDIIVGVVVLASALISFMRGFIREVLTIAGVIGGILAAIFVGPAFAPVVREWFGTGDGKKLFDIIPMEIVADATAYGVIFIAVVIVISVVSHFTAGAAKAVGLGPVDRTLGLMFGVARALLLLGLVYLPFHLLMTQERKEEFFGASNTHYFIEKISGVMASYLPDSEEAEETIQKGKEDAGDLFKKKLQDSELLNSGKKDAEKPAPAPAEEGYQEEQREKLEQLFNEPPVTEPAPNAVPPAPPQPAPKVNS